MTTFKARKRGNRKTSRDKIKPTRDSIPGGLVFIVCGQTCGQRKNNKRWKPKLMQKMALVIGCLDAFIEN